MKQRDWLREKTDEYFRAQEEMERSRIVRQFVDLAREVGYTIDDLWAMLASGVSKSDLTGMVFSKAKGRVA